MAGLLERGPTPLLPVHDREHSQHAAACGLDRADRLERRSTGGDHVLYDHHRGTGKEASLDALPRAVSLGLFAHGEGVNRPAAPGAPTGGGDANATGSAPRVSPPTTSGRHPRVARRSSASAPMTARPSAAMVVRRASM